MFIWTKCYMWETQHICVTVPILQAVISLWVQIPRRVPDFVFLFSSYSELSIRVGSVYPRPKVPFQQHWLYSYIEGNCVVCTVILKAAVCLCSYIKWGCMFVQLYWRRVCGLYSNIEGGCVVCTVILKAAVCLCNYIKSGCMFVQLYWRRVCGLYSYIEGGCVVCTVILKAVVWCVQLYLRRLHVYAALLKVVACSCKHIEGGCVFIQLYWRRCCLITTMLRAVTCSYDIESRCVFM
jgi:hypothetical protein